MNQPGYCKGRLCVWDWETTSLLGLTCEIAWVGLLGRLLLELGKRGIYLG